MWTQIDHNWYSNSLGYLDTPLMWTKTCLFSHNNYLATNLVPSCSCNPLLSACILFVLLYNKTKAKEPRSIMVQVLIKCCHWSQSPAHWKNCRNWVSYCQNIHSTHSGFLPAARIHILWVNPWILMQVVTLVWHWVTITCYACPIQVAQQQIMQAGGPNSCGLCIW